MHDLQQMLINNKSAWFTTKNGAIYDKKGMIYD